MNHLYGCPSFRGEYAALSNFAPSLVRFEGEVYATVEHAFQAAKTLDPVARQALAHHGTWGQDPAAAKRAGRGLTLRADWDLVKEEIMEELLRQKFALLVPRLALRRTGTNVIEEANRWNDTFWGVTASGLGQNKMGLLLMKIRDEL